MGTIKSKLFKKKSINSVLHNSNSEHGLKKVLGLWDLVALGVAAIIGAGIFSTIGNAASSGGPGVVFLFLFTAIACGFSAFCYADFAARVPVSGSAYTYAYISLGELLAWIIGWDLIMEYAIGNIAVSISWSDYFTSMLSGFGIHFPTHLSMDWLTAKRGFEEVNAFLSQGKNLNELVNMGVSPLKIDIYNSYLSAPKFLGIPIICDLPAFLITVIVTSIVYVGIHESKRVSNLMVLLKLLVLFVIIGVGAFYIDTKNWNPFMPNGLGGVLKGVSGVFFAYIGFDAISTTAEECKNPGRDLPKAMILSLVICTILYVLVALVLTGMVPYSSLGVGDPLAFVFGKEGANLPFLSGVIAVSAVVALFTVHLVYQLGQPRIWMAMSRDGLLPKIFSSIHPKYKTPWFSTLVTGFVVGIPSLFMNLTEVTDLTSIGTLFAFLLVSVGCLTLEPEQSSSTKSNFRMPYFHSKYIFPILTASVGVVILYFYPSYIFDLTKSLNFMDWHNFKHKIPIIIYIMGILYLNVITFFKDYSLIPVLSVAMNGYLMTELGWINWVRFLIWLLIGLCLYFFYGLKKLSIKK